MNPHFYIRAEDFVVAYIGPFTSISQAHAHIQMCAERGDSAVMIITESVGEDSMGVIAPEDDVIQ